MQKYWYLQHWIYYIKKIDDYENIYSVNPLLIMQIDIWKKKMKINT